MDGAREFLMLVRRRASTKLLFLPHAIRQMSRPERMISTAEVRAVIDQGNIIEDYPDDARGHSALILGGGTGGRPIHVVCSPQDEFLAVITAYLPDPAGWTDDYKQRKTK